MFVPITEREKTDHDAGTGLEGGKIFNTFKHSSNYRQAGLAVGSWVVGTFQLVDFSFRQSRNRRFLNRISTRQKPGLTLFPNENILRTSMAVGANSGMFSGVLTCFEWSRTMNTDVQANEYDNEIDLVLTYHKGDVRAAITTLLKDRDFLIKEIEYASLTMSMGFARGWKPTVFSK